MRMASKRTRSAAPPGRVIAVLITTALVLLAAPGAGLAADDDASTTFDGLVRIEDASVAKAYIDPEVDFSVFERVMILEPGVAFRKNWRRDQNRARSQRVTSRDMERIKTDVAALFKTVFTERLEADGGYEIVDQADYDVLLLRPAIIDLDVSVPDTMRQGRSVTLSASTGGATLYIELYDSVTGDIVGRAADRRFSRDAHGMVAWSSRVTNTAEARRLFQRWADTLVSFLDKHYTKE
jgi:hypothetical protein